MTTMAPVSESAAPDARLRMPGAVFWMFLTAPILIGFGAFVTVAMQPFVNSVSMKGDALVMTIVGLILLCLGVAFLMAALVLVGVRSIAQQQTDLLREARAEHRGA